MNLCFVCDIRTRFESYIFMLLMIKIPKSILHMFVVHMFVAI